MPGGFGGFHPVASGAAGGAVHQLPQQNTFPRGPGFDPARMTAPKLESVITNRRVELPSAAYQLDRYPNGQFPSDLPLRRATNTKGKPIVIRVNQYKVAAWPQGDVYQYDINIGNGAEKRGLIMKVWNSQAVQTKLRGAPWLWDGNKIAWTSVSLPEVRISVDLDAESGRSRRNAQAPVYVVIRPSKTIRMAMIEAYLAKRVPFDNSILECINFLDHAMRMYPSTLYTSIKRSFFARGSTRNPLDNVIEAMRGVYSSIRLCNPQASMGGASTGLALNVDVANGTFWVAQDLHQAARNLCKERNRGNSYQVFANLLRPVPYKDGIAMSEDFKTLRKMAKLKFHVKHRGKEGNPKEYMIKKFLFEKDMKFAKEGCHAKNTYFEEIDRSLPEGAPNRSKSTSIYDYFKRKYNVTLQYWMLPLVVTTRDGMFPMEVCELLPNQKYQFKLSPDQTANMIKFAVTRPKVRTEAINHGVAMLKWAEDPYLKHFGIKIDPKMTETQARLLPPPEVQYTAGKATPGTSGRWDLRGKKFLKSNPEPLKSWAVVIIQEAVDVPTAKNFLNVFINTYIGHGGKVENKNPPIVSQVRGQNESDVATAARNQAGAQSQANPQILFFILPGRDSFMYERLKKNCECRYALVSQMLNVAHVKKASPQYCSNVCMKVNSKLGGTTCKVADVRPPKPFFPRPTMMIGADVSHATPGSPQASMAAITMSFDAECARFAAAVQTNGHRVEMITDTNMETMVVPLFRKWVEKVGGGKGPQHIYYFRDGVSEGQYAHVLDQEIRDLKGALKKAFGAAADSIKFTVVICTKRHHIRFFPKSGDNAAADKNDNPLPGTLVERDVTHPFEYDFYLCAHTAIQGTARPVHYHVILDEANCNVDEFQRMVYQMSYQYARSTTPVSIIPAVYYAHIASNRARAHEAAAASDGPRGGQKYEELRQDQAVARIAGVSVGGGGSSQTGTSNPIEARPLLPLGGSDTNPDVLTKIRTGMWYI